MDTLIIARHPLIQHKVTLLRDRRTPTKIFKELLDEIAMLMAYEATSDLPLESTEVDTPLERTMGVRVSGKHLPAGAGSCRPSAEAPRDQAGALCAGSSCSG